MAIPDTLSSVSIRYGVLTRKFFLPSTSDALKEVVRREFVIDEDVPLGLSCGTPSEENSFMVVPLDVELLRKFDGDSVLDLRIYAKPRGRSSGESKDLAPNAVVAQFNFVGQGDRELTFSAGDVIVVEGQYDADWWKGYIGDRRGFFPANYVSGLEHVSDVAKVEDSTTNYQDAEYFDGYSHLGIHLEMLRDESRTKSYQNAIMQCADFLKGKTVLDIGCGSGILSVFCAQAGAEHVYAAEASDVADRAKVVFEENGLSDKITLVRGKIEDTEMPFEKVDVIVSEWMGTLLICESMIASVLYAREKYLQPDGLMLPETSDIFLAPICIEEYYNDRVSFWDDVYGVKMSGLKSIAMDEFFSKPVFDRIIEENEIVAKPCSVATIDMAKATVDDLEAIASDFEFQVEKTGIVHGFGGWFDSIFRKAPFDVEDELTLSTSPYSRPTHWKQVMFVLSEPIQVEKGTTISGTFKLVRQKFWRRHFEVTLEFRVGDSRESTTQVFPLWR